MTLVDEADVLANGEDGVHVVGVDDGCYAPLVGDLRYQSVDDASGNGVETRVRFVAEEVARVLHNGAGNGHTFLHAARYLGRIEIVGCGIEIDTSETLLSTSPTLRHGERREHVERETDILLNSEVVEEGRALKDHANLLTELESVGFAHAGHVSSVVEDRADIDPIEADQTLEQHGFARAALANDEVGHAVVEV